MTQYRQPRQSYPPRREQEQPALPAGYLRNGYFDTSNNTLPEVIVDWPKDLAGNLYASRQMKTAQLRRFFNEARRIEGKLDAGASFPSLKPEILKFDNYAADAVKKKKAPPLFKEFIEQNLKWATKEEKAFRRGFIPHFEAVVAYFPEAK